MLKPSVRRAKDLAAQVLAKLEEHRPPSPYAPRMEPMDELVSCILSQHSADVVTFPTYDRLRARFPTWKEVAALTPDELASWVKPVGLAGQKSKAILTALARVKAEFGDYTLEPLRRLDIGDALAWLESLPGVGPKTASIVLCFAFGRHAVPVDTHVWRVCLRVGLLPPKSSPAFQHAWLREIVADGAAYRFHMALLAHGRATCRARAPRCTGCVLLNMCPEGRKLGTA